MKSIIRDHKILNRIIAELKMENDYLKSPMYKFEMTQDIKGVYSILLNPPKKRFKSLRNSRASYFEIDVKDVICICSDGLTKWVYFTCPQKSIEGELLIFNKLGYNGKIEEFLDEHDQTKIHLCKVSKSHAINLSCYDLDAKNLIFNLETSSKEEYKEIPIGPNFYEEYIKRKAVFDFLISFQKI
ncbi:MAG: hypothetical protein ACKVQV_10180 [Bacteroidia bacterium]